MAHEIKNDLPFGIWTLKSQDLASFKWWMTYDPIHKPEPLTPLAGTALAFLEQHGFCFGAEKVSLPVSNGMCCRIGFDGYEAISDAMTTTPKQKRERIKTFEKSIRCFSKNFESLWCDYSDKGKVGSLLEEIQNNYMKIGTLESGNGFFDLDKFKTKLAHLSNGALLNLFLDVMNINRRTWEIHIELSYLSFSVYTEFERFIQENFGFGDESPLFKKMLQAIDNKIYDCDRELWRLVNILIESDLVNTFKENPVTVILSELSKSSQGEKWVQEFKAFLGYYGRRSAVPHDILKKIWLEDPSLVLSIIKDRLKDAPINFVQKRQQLIEERNKTSAELRSIVDNKKRGEFDYLLKAATLAYCWNEDHNYWVEQMWSSSTRFVVLEMGRRFCEGGSISEVEDIFFLNLDEINAVYFGAVNGQLKFQALVAERKDKWKKAFARKPPRIVGEWNRAEVKDPILVKVFGLGPLSEPTEHVQVFGYAGSSGVCEGIAEVVENVNDLHSVKSGSILVTGATNPAWTVIFSKVKGVVTDHGGTLSHAAIVAREYGIPAVVGTGDATKKIRNGQKIRVDGDRGLVWLL